MASAPTPAPTAPIESSVPPSSKFLSAVSFTLREEGGYTPGIAGDTGGETYRGVSRNNWPQWPGWQRIDAAKSNPEWEAMPSHRDSILAMDEVLQDSVVVFYRNKFWVPNYEKFNSQKVCTFLFDMGVPMGVSQAVTLFQRSVNDCGVDPQIVVDGQFGGQTVAAANMIFPDDLMLKLRDRYKAFYMEIATKTPAKRKFLNGWFARVDAHMTEIVTQ